MSEFTVTGADDFLKLSKALKAAGRTELRKALNKGLRDAAKPLIPLAKQAARTSLPRRGGLAEKVARDSALRVAVKTGSSPGVRIVAPRKNAAVRTTNQGFVRHPVYGSTRFVSQQVPGGWFDDTLRDAAPGVQPGLERTLLTIVEQIIREAR